MHHNLLSAKDFRKSLRAYSFLAGVILLLSTGCQPSAGPERPRDAGVTDTAMTEAGTAAEGEQRLDVVVTVGMVADLVRYIGGERIDVTQLMGSGVDPHLYKATRDDVRRLMNADLIFYSGLMLEGRLTDTLTKIGSTRPVIAVTEQIPAARLLKSEEHGDHWDPHVWMDVDAWSQCLPVIVRELKLLDPVGAAGFEERSTALRDQMRQLHEYGLTAIRTIPEDRRVLITSHDAFNYFGRAYGLEVVGVQGLSTESEAGLARINELVDLLVERRITAVFVESSVPRKNITALIDGAASRGQQAEIGGELYSDAMGEPGTYEGTYVGMLDHNITLVARHLGGNAPPQGLNGQLRPENP